MLRDLNPTQIARFEEQSINPMGVDLEVQSTRSYPYGTTAAHVLGHLRRDDDSKEGEEAFFSFWLPDYRGIVGIEYGFDKELRGMAGAKSVLVNNVGYRQTENVWSPAEPGGERGADHRPAISSGQRSARCNKASSARTHAARWW